MKTINEIRAFTATPEYGKTFWNAMRIKHNAEAEMHDAMSATTGAFCAPAADETDFRKAIFAESVIRPLATELKKHTGGDVIWAKDSSDYAEFVPEGAAISGFDAQNDFTRFPVATHKIDGLVKLSTEFALDADFDLRKYIFERMGKSFARAEDRPSSMVTERTSPSAFSTKLKEPKQGSLQMRSPTMIASTCSSP